MHAAEEFRTTIDDALERSGVNTIMLYAAKVEFIDSSGLGVILGRYKKVTAAGGRIIVVGAQPQVCKVLAISGIQSLVAMYDLADDAWANI